MIQPGWTNNHGRQYPCSKRIKAGYNKCKSPTLIAGKIETMVVDQLRPLLRHPDVIARTCPKFQERSKAGSSPELIGELDELHQRREQLQDSIRAVLSRGNQNAFMADELERLNGELNSLERSIAKLESQPVAAEPIELANVTDTLQRIDPIWKVLHPEEQRRVLELLVETITVSKENVEVRFRANGIEQVVEELEPMGVGSNENIERFMRSIKSECLDRLIFFGEDSQQRVVASVLEQYHVERNHQGLTNAMIQPHAEVGQLAGELDCRERLGGMLRYRTAA